jgi:hypothetical protein
VVPVVPVDLGVTRAPLELFTKPLLAVEATQVSVLSLQQAVELVVPMETV